MIGFHNLLGKKCLYPVFVASATPLMGAGSPSSQKNHPTSSDGHPSPYPDIPDTLAYQVQVMQSAQSLLFPTGSILKNVPEKISDSPHPPGIRYWPCNGCKQSPLSFSPNLNAELTTAVVPTNPDPRRCSVMDFCRRDPGVQNVSFPRLSRFPPICITF